MLRHGASTQSASGWRKCTDLAVMKTYPSDMYINRELSWLEFNQRVLDEAVDESNPLLERLKFLCITCSNLDEFFEVRVAGLKQQKQGQSNETGPDGLSPTDQLNKISRRVRRMFGDQYRIWNANLLPALEAEGIRFYNYPDVPERHREPLERYFRESVYPVLTPLAIDQGHPFPQLLNKSLNVVVELEGDGLTTDIAVVQVPRILPRVVPLESEPGCHEFVFIGQLIQEHVGSLFHGVRVRGAHQFRITRNSNLYFDEEEADNLLSAIESELRRANRGNAVRIEVQSDCPQSVCERLLAIFNLEKGDLYVADGPINLLRLMPVATQADRPELLYRPYKPAEAVPVGDDESLFSKVAQRDWLLHHPYQSFKSVVDFVETAAEDPDVLAIKQTLYRTSGDSPIIHALIDAAQNGKQVTVIIELKARFDEAANIKWARIMQEAGINVVYGLLGLKTHCKACLVVRRETDGIRRYVHLGTGNYNPSTARLYTDLGLLTADELIGVDTAELFNLLTGVSRFPGMKKLLVAPFNMHDRMMEMVERETAHAREGLPSGITAKMNSLVDEEIIEALYRASAAGVRIRLIVRGICCLRPGVSGVSENIEVRSIIGRLLEHSRVFRFENAGDPRFYIGSADWMPRNFFRRVEACVPIEQPDAKERLNRLLEMYWRDNCKARRLLSDGTYERVGCQGEAFNVQEALIAEVAGSRRTSRVAAG